MKEGSFLGPEPQWKQGSTSPGNFCLRYFLVTQLSSPSNWDKGKELAVPQPRLGTRPGPVVNCCVPGLTVHTSQAVCGGGARSCLSCHPRATENVLQSWREGQTLRAIVAVFCPEQLHWL